MMSDGPHGLRTRTRLDREEGRVGPSSSSSNSGASSLAQSPAPPPPPCRREAGRRAGGQVGRHPGCAGRLSRKALSEMETTKADLDAHGRAGRAKYGVQSVRGDARAERGAAPRGGRQPRGAPRRADAARAVPPAAAAVTDAQTWTAARSAPRPTGLAELEREAASLAQGKSLAELERERARAPRAASALAAQTLAPQRSRLAADAAAHAAKAVEYDHQMAAHDGEVRSYLEAQACRRSRPRRGRWSPAAPPTSAPRTSSRTTPKGLSNLGRARRGQRAVQAKRPRRARAGADARANAMRAPRRAVAGGVRVSPGSEASQRRPSRRRLAAPARRASPPPPTTSGSRRAIAFKPTDIPGLEALLAAKGAPRRPPAGDRAAVAAGPARRRGPPRSRPDARHERRATPRAAAAAAVEPVDGARVELPRAGPPERPLRRRGRPRSRARGARPPRARAPWRRRRAAAASAAGLLGGCPRGRRRGGDRAHRLDRPRRTRR